MGLDWLVDAKVKEGREAEHGKLVEELALLQQRHETLWGAWLVETGKERSYATAQEYREEDESKEILAELEVLTVKKDDCLISPMETLGAPRVGYDAPATEYATKEWTEAQEQFKKMHPQQRAYWDRPLEEYLKDIHGYYVPQLVKSNGLGRVTGIADVGSESFRGKVLSWAEHIIGEEMVNEAYSDHEADALVDYAERLRDRAAAYAEEKDLKWVVTARQDLSDEEFNTKLGDNEDLWNLLYCFDAADWAEFWGSNGHSMHAWY